MFEELIDAFLNDNLEKGKKIVKDNYDEISELVYEMAVANETFKDSEGNPIGQDLLAFLSLCGHRFDYEDSNGNNALHAAVNNENQDYVTIFTTVPELFLKKNKDGYNPVMLSFTKTNEEIKIIAAMQIGEEINDVFKINGENLTYLTLAIFTSEPRLLATLIANENLDYSIHKPYIDEVEWEDDDENDEMRQNILDNYLLSKTVNPNEEMENEVNNNDDSDLFNLDNNEKESSYDYIVNNDIDSLIQLINNDECDIEEELPGYTLFNIAILNQNQELIDTLLYKANINHRTTNGITPLLCAVMKENIDLIKKLIKMGAYMDSPIYNGLEPIFFAVSKNNLLIVQELLENGVYINKYNRECINSVFKGDKYKECIDLINNYNNPNPPKKIFPFEDNYLLGSNPTLEDDGFHQVKWVIETSYGSEMINCDGKSAFGLPGKSLTDFIPVKNCIKIVAPTFYLNNEEKEQYNDEINEILLKSGIEFKESDEKLRNVVGYLYSDGTVTAVDLDTGEEIEDVSKWENIIDIIHTDFNLVGLCKDGTIKVYQPEFYDYYKNVLEWKNIRKISAGYNKIYAIDKNDNLYFEGSEMGKKMLGEDITKLEQITKCKNISSNLDCIVVWDINNNLIGINVSNLIDNVKDFKQVEIGSACNVSILKNDGTVLSFGKNSCCECNTIKWHDISRIQATGISVIGYASDGEILCTENMSMIDYMSHSCWVPGFGNAISMHFGEPLHNIMNV